MTNIERWWIYQQERFPVFKNGLLIAVFSFAAVGYSLLLRSDSEQRSPSALRFALIAFITLFLFFLQLRIADEFKDFAEDSRYRPYRPVPRGLVSLKELGIVGIGSAVIQLGLSLAVGLHLVTVLAIVWLYLGLMSREFFAPTWLKAHPPIYLLSHMVIMPLITLYATGCDWVAAGVAPSPGLGWLLAVSFWNGVAIEVGRKIRAASDEEPGVETYTALWGRQKAVAAWLTAIWLAALTTLLAAEQIDFIVPIALLLVLLLTAVLIVAWRFLARPVTQNAKRFEWISGLWTLLVYLDLGILPLLLKP
jgi:4-hydroxybenzoate polyprenyltransferase